MPAPDVREARPADYDAVAAFTADTWPDREFPDYLPDVFPAWVDSDDPDQRLVVATVDDEPVGVCQAQFLTVEEAWIQGVRVAPAHRGADHSRAMTHDLFDWAADRGATVIRNMVFGWNNVGLAQSRALGFEPATAVRWAEPDPDADASPALDVQTSVPAAWAAWTDSDARTALGGLALADDAAWALSELTRDRLAGLADAERVLAVVADGARGMTARVGVRERRDGEGGTRTVADYAAGCWADAEAAAAVVDAVRADAAAVGADAVRLCVPETPRAVADVAAAGAPLNDEPEYVLAADLVGRRQ